MTHPEVVEIPWDVERRPWAEYIGNTLYSASAQIVMDICAGCLLDFGRLPVLGEVRNLSKLDDFALRKAFDMLRETGWQNYASVGDAIPALPKPRILKDEPRKKEPIPAELRWAVWSRDNFTCRHCKSRVHLSVDHIIPESLGGPMSLDNLQTLCKSCNSRKGAR